MDIKYKASPLNKILPKYTSSNKNKIKFWEDFFSSTGSNIKTNGVNNDDIIKKFISPRGLTGTLLNCYINDGKCNYSINKSTTFFNRNINESDDLYLECGIDTNIEKDFTIFCEALAYQYLKFIQKNKTENDYELTTLSEIYTNLLNNPKQYYFGNLDNFNKNKIYKYLEKINEKNILEKTILDVNKTRNFYDFYVCNDIKYISNNEDEIIKDIDISYIKNNLSNNLIFKASSGIGKTMLMKHLLLNAVNTFSNNYIIPLKIDLKKYNSDTKIDFIDYILTQINYVIDMEKEDFIFLIEKGLFIFLIDDLDELNEIQANCFCNSLQKFSCKYKKNIFIINTNSNNYDRYLKNFSVLQLQPFNQHQATLLVEKLDYIDNNFKASKTCVSFMPLFYSFYKGFCSNPYLLTTSLITFSKFQYYNDKKSLFYDDIFSALWDNYKTKNISIEFNENKITKFLSILCYSLYIDDKYEFKAQEFENYYNDIDIELKKLNPFKDISSKDLLKFLYTKLNILNYSEDKYQFIQPYFQDYFAAIHILKLDLKKLPNLSNLSKQLDNKKGKSHIYLSACTYDSDDINSYGLTFTDNYSIINILYEKNRKKTIKYIIKPILNSYINDGKSSDEKFYNFITKVYDFVELENETLNVYLHNTNSFVIDFVVDEISKDESKQIKELINEDIEPAFSKNYEINCANYKNYDIDISYTHDCIKLNMIQYKKIKTDELKNNFEKYNKLLNSLKNNSIFGTFISLQKKFEEYKAIVDKYDKNNELKNI